MNFICSYCNKLINTLTRKSLPLCQVGKSSEKIMLVKMEWLTVEVAVSTPFVNSSHQMLPLHPTVHFFVCARRRESLQDGYTLPVLFEIWATLHVGSLAKISKPTPFCVQIFWSRTPEVFLRRQTATMLPEQFVLYDKEITVYNEATNGRPKARKNRVYT